MHNTIFYIIISFLIFDFILERLLDYLNTTRMKAELPNELKGIYNAEEYARQQNYSRENKRFSRISSTFSFILTLIVLFTGLLGWLDAQVQQIATSPILQALMFFCVIGIVSDIITTPFSVYATFVIEEKYGFNKTTPKTFVLDKLKGYLISLIVGGGLLSLIVWIYLKTGSYFWIVTLAVVAGFSIFMAMFYTTLLLPLFNKQTPLEQGSLRSKIEEYGAKVGFKIQNIFVMDGSKRSSKANAFFSGLGPQKRIVLYDTLINDLAEEEVVGVLAHEVGHYKKKHTLVSIFLSILSTAIMLFVLSLLLGNADLAVALGGTKASFHMSVLAFGMLYSPVSFLLGIAMNVLSRKNEYEADHFAKQTFGAEALVESLKKLSVKSLSNLTPHPLVVYLEYSHPTLLQRINKLRA